MDAHTQGEQSLCAYRGGSCLHVLHYEQGQDQLDPHHQGTHAEINKVK